MTSRCAALVVLLVLGTGCGGVDALQRCVDHAVEEGVDAARAEEGCRAVISEE